MSSSLSTAAAISDVKFRPDFEQLRTVRMEERSRESLTIHYLLEARLAKKLAGSSRAERFSLYSEVYRELFAGVPDHPQHRAHRASRVGEIERQAGALCAQLGASDVYVEIGCGDAALTKAVASRVAAAIGVDVTAELVASGGPAAFRFLLSDGITLELPDCSADLVFSNQLMEHLHVDDAQDQLREIYRVLKPGGRYICCTPNRLSGPHDISVYFSHVPTGFHLREYDHRSLGALFRASGFKRVQAMVSAKGRRFTVPLAVAGAAETLLEIVPVRVRNQGATGRITSALLGMTLVGWK